MTYMRARVRTIASSISHAWCARNVMPRPTCAAGDGQVRSHRPEVAALGDPRARRQQPRQHGQRRGDDRRREDEARPHPGATEPNVHAATSVATASGADSVRRRLSTIFQRAMPGMEPRVRRPVASRARPRIHGRSCQSPRAQRCSRAAATR